MAKRSRRRSALRALAVLGVVAVGASFVPVPEPAVPNGAAARPIVWGPDGFWQSLERTFEDARRRGCGDVTGDLDRSLAAVDAWIAWMDRGSPHPGDAGLRALESELFAAGPLFGACPRRVGELVERFSQMREVLETKATRWDPRARATRDQLYRLLYGGRAMIEELLLQMPPREAARLALVGGSAAPSEAPSATVRGVQVHSGDLLLSRGGAPTSALIARGNDYPGNFSHVALVHVDAETHEALAIEAHIERGVVVTTAAEYLRDKKLRIMLLRLRPDLPALARDPLLAHRAAEAALDEARRRHIPYDFAMDFDDPSEQFCSEVASSAYRDRGVRLWEGLSAMSAPGLRRWLGSFGVTHFETQAPADLEYDPKLVVVVEWRDPDALWQDHLDNAVIDAMLEGAERGEDIRAPWAMLPIARLAKAYSWAINLFGRVGPVPEGMSASTALRAKALAERHHAIRERLVVAADAYRARRGYRAPYWELVRLARAASRTP